VLNLSKESHKGWYRLCQVCVTETSFDESHRYVMNMLSVTGTGDRMIYRRCHRMNWSSTYSRSPESWRRRYQCDCESQGDSSGNTVERTYHRWIVHIFFKTSVGKSVRNLSINEERVGLLAMKKRWLCASMLL